MAPRDKKNLHNELPGWRQKQDAQDRRINIVVGIFKILDPMGDDPLENLPLAIVVGLSCMFLMFICVGWQSLSDWYTKTFPPSLVESIDPVTGLNIGQVGEFTLAGFPSSLTVVPNFNENVGPEQKFQYYLTDTVLLYRNPKEPYDNFIITRGYEAAVFKWDMASHTLKEFYYTPGNESLLIEVPANTPIAVSVEGRAVIVNYKGGIYIWIVDPLTQ